MTRLHLTILGLDPEHQLDRRPAGNDPLAGDPLWVWQPDENEPRVRHPLAQRLQDGRVRQDKAPRATTPDCMDPDLLALNSLGFAGDAESVPIAALRWLGDLRLGALAPDVPPDLSTASSSLICAFDPVHLKAETDHALVFGSRLLCLSAAERDRLFDDLDAWLREDGLRLVRSTGDRAYLVFDEPEHPRLGTRTLPPLACALNRNAEPLLTGDDALRPLRRWLTELQMWLHLHPVNEERARDGRPVVNSFWPYGRAPLDQVPVQQAEDAGMRIWTDSPVVLGWRSDARAWPDDFPVSDDLLSAAEDIHVVLTEPLWCWLEGDEQGWRDALDHIDGWLAHQLKRQPDLNWTLDDGLGRSWIALTGMRGFMHRLFGHGQKGQR